ncbi:hypothetical protein BG000_007784 [Podila horticola]|nr:hypothetical protein BG000_007784 [Podila horticola]
MRKVFSLALVGLFTSIASAAPVCVASDALGQVVLSHDSLEAEDVLKPKDDGIIYLPPRRSRRAIDLDAEMRDLISREMEFSYSGSEYISGAAQELCTGGPHGETYMPSVDELCGVQILTNPVIQVIPARQISRDIICTTPRGCSICLEETVTISTTHSVEIGMSFEVSSKPFGVGVSFTTSIGYGFSHTSETSTALQYCFDLELGDRGYIGMVNAQISSQLRYMYCKCYDQACVDRCRNGNWQISKDLQHQKVIEKNGTPRGYVAFVYEN